MDPTGKNPASAASEQQEQQEEGVPMADTGDHLARASSQDVTSPQPTSTQESSCDLPPTNDSIIAKASSSEAKSFLPSKGAHSAEGGSALRRTAETDDYESIDDSMLAENSSDKFENEFDFYSKSPVKSLSFYQFYTFLAMMVFILVVAVAVAAITVSKSRANDGYDESQPTSFSGSLGIQQLIERLVGNENLKDPNSPYSKALDWIIFEDPQNLTLDDNNLIQRYTAAYFYFATAVNKPWLCCNPPISNETDTCVFQRMWSAADPDAYSYDELLATRWLSNSTECKWAGIVCDDFDQIRSVELHGLNLNGAFPDGIILWPYLQSLGLSFNELKGSLPPGLGSSMKNLLSIGLNDNLFSGEIPSDWWMASNLLRLNLGDNLLVGTIPPEITGLKRMQGLFLYGNMLDGPIPDELGDLSQLLYLRLNRNMMNGSIPSSIGRLAEMKTLWLFKNALTGRLPTEISNFSNMHSFRVHTNDLTGELPHELYDMRTVSRLELNDCNFTGPLLPAIGNFKSMTSFEIDGNHFSGQLPTEMGLLRNIIHLRLDDNDFVGSVPAELCALRNPNDFQRLEADCLPDAVTGIAELACPVGCCTICCDASGQECVVQNT